MKTHQTVLALIGLAILGAPAPASAQDGSTNQLAIRQMRQALTGDAPQPDLSHRLDQVRGAILTEILRSLNSSVLSETEVDKELRVEVEDQWREPVSILRKQVNGINVVPSGIRSAMVALLWLTPRP
jgi:hypothetical protein